MPSPPLAPLIIPIAQPEFVKARMNENPLLKVPPASRGNRTGARLGSPREAGGNYELWLGDWYKGTTVRHEVFEAGAIVPSASVNGQARLFALTPFVPLSRRRGMGNALQGTPPCAPTPRAHSVGEGECAAGRTAVRPYTPRPPRGRGAGGEGEKAVRAPHTVNSSDVPLSALSPSPAGGRGGTRCRAHRRAPLHPAPTAWERGWG